MPKTSRGRRTREKILTAAEEEFGERGFHATAINRITERAGVAMGTFYVYFESKEQIFESLVTYMSLKTREWIRDRVAGSPNRLEAERRGIAAYIAFVREHPHIYHIIDEAQFVAPEAYKKHYSDFADAYARQLDAAEESGEITSGDNMMRGWALVGASVFLGMRYGIWDRSTPIEEVVEAYGSLIESGLRAD